MTSSIYVTVFRDTDLTDDEKGKIDGIKSKHGMLDSRDGDFQSIKETFKDDGKNIVLYAEITDADDGKKNEVVESAKELKGLLPNVVIEVNDDDKKLL